jgi:hypothetical protein
MREARACSSARQVRADGRGKAVQLPDAMPGRYLRKGRANARVILGRAYARDQVGQMGEATQGRCARQFWADARGMAGQMCEGKPDRRERLGRDDAVGNSSQMREARQGRRAR